MAIYGVSWVPGAHVRFGNLDFVITTEEGLVQAPAAVQPLHFTGLDAIIAMATSSSALITGG